MSVNRRQAIFDRGAVALAAAVPEAPSPIYCCPLCLCGFDRSAIEVGGILTEEHVPPKALGGQVLCLTCQPCNNAAGTALDSYVSSHAEQIDFMAGRPVGPQSVVMSVGTVDLRGEVYGPGDGGILAIGHPHRNHPDRPTEMGEVLDALTSSDPANQSIRFTLDRKPLSKSRVAIGWLRHGYLAAFAAFGYRYILRRSLDAVREQITTPHDEAGTTPVLIAGPNAELMQPSYMLVDEPENLRCLLVNLGRAIVLLPPVLGDTGDLFDRIAEHRAANRAGLASVEFGGQVVPWDDHARYLLDLGPKADAVTNGPLPPA